MSKVSNVAPRKVNFAKFEMAFVGQPSSLYYHVKSVSSNVESTLKFLSGVSIRWFMAHGQRGTGPAMALPGSDPGPALPRARGWAPLGHEP